MDYAALAQLALQAYQAYNANKTQSPQRLPEDPSMVNLRNKIIGYTENSPTRNMLGDMLKPGIERAGNSSFQLPKGYGGYNPTAGMDQAPKYDLSKIFGSLATSDNPNPQSVGQGPTGTPPPPPPENFNASKGSTRRRLGVATKGLIGGLGSPLGMLSGSLGALKQRGTDKAKEQASHDAYDAWVKQYGSSFGGTPPKSMDEYKAWYQKTYGRPYQG